MLNVKSLPVHSSILFLKLFRLLYYRTVILSKGSINTFDIMFEVSLNAILAYSLVTLQTDAMDLRTFQTYYIFDTIFFVMTLFMYKRYISNLNDSSSIEAFREDVSAQNTLYTLKCKGANLPTNVEVKPKTAEKYYIDVRIVQLLSAFPVYLFMMEV